MSNPHAESITKYADLFLDSPRYITGTNRGNKMHGYATGPGNIDRVLVDYGQAARGFRIMDRYSGDSKLTIQRIMHRQTKAARHIVALSLLGAFDPEDAAGHEITIVDEGEVYRTLLPELQGEKGPRGLLLENFSKLDRPILKNPNVVVATPRYAEHFAGRLAVVASFAGLSE